MSFLKNQTSPATTNSSNLNTNSVKQVIVVANDSSMLNWDTSKVKIMAKLGNWVSALQETLPLTSANQPLAYIDPEAIAATGMTSDISDFLDNPPTNAVIPLNYLEGFATIGGLPFWERLDGEPIPYYELFKTYRDDIAPGIKMTSYASDGELKAGAKDSDIIGTGKLPSRMLYKLAEKTGCDMRKLNALRQIWHWQDRLVAYDGYKNKQRQIMRQREVQMMEGRHAKVAKQIFQQCTDYMNSHIEDLSPKTALQWFETAVKLERLSLGLSGDKPGEPSEGGKLASTLVQINNQIGEGTEKNQQNGGSQSATEAETRTLEILKILQSAGALRPQDSEKKAEVVEANFTPVTEEQKPKATIQTPAQAKGGQTSTANIQTAKAPQKVVRITTKVLGGGADETEPNS